MQGIGLFDLACVFSSISARPDLPIAVSKAEGTHTLLLAGFQVLSNVGAEQSGGPQSIDAFNRGLLEWITLGGMQLQLSAKGNPLATPALKALRADR